MYSKLNLFEIGELEWDDNPDINYYRTGELDYLQVNINNTTLSLVEQLRDLMFDSVIICLRDLEGIVENIGEPDIVPRRVVNLDEEETEADVRIRENLELFRSTPNLTITMGIVSKLNRNSVVGDNIFEHMDFFEIIFDVAEMPNVPQYNNINYGSNLSTYNKDILWKLLYAVFYYNHIVNSLNLFKSVHYVKTTYFIIIPLNNKELQMSLLTYLFKPITVNKSLCSLSDTSSWNAYIDNRGLSSSLDNQDDDARSYTVNRSKNYYSAKNKHYNNTNNMTLQFLDTLPE